MWCRLPAIFVRRHVLSLTALSLLFVALFTTIIFNHVTHATAGINRTINFQGRLFTDQGDVVPDGYYNMQFKIYQDGDGQTVGTTGTPAGTPEWTETRLNNAGKGVQVKNGFLSVDLGSVDAFGSTIDWNQDTLWLSMNVGDTANCTPFASCTPDGEMLPMRRFSSTPYALNAENANTLNGLTSSGFVQLAPNVVQADATTNTSIYINKTGVGNLMQLQDGGVDAFKLNNSGDIEFGANADHTISVATAAASTAGNALSVVAGAGGSGAGSNGGTLALQGGAAGGTNGNGGNVTIDAGAKTGSGTDGVINIGTAHASTIQIGATAGTATQNVNIGNNNTSGSTTNVTIGAGGSATAGTTAIQSKDNTTISTNGTTRATFDTTGKLYVGDGITSTGTGTFTIQGSTGAAANAGYNLTLLGGTGGSNSNGGDITLQGGTGTGTGVQGQIKLAAGGYTTTTISPYGSSTTIAQASVDNYSSIAISASAPSLTITVPAPTTKYDGRVLYVQLTGSNSITLAPNGGSSTTMTPNTVYALVWNTTLNGWLAAGTDSNGFIQNQNATNQVANFRINGTGQAANFRADTLDAIAASGSITLGATNATTIGIGNSTAATAVTIQGGTSSTAVAIQSGAAGTISVGTANAANNINIGSASLSSGTQAIVIGGANTSGGTQNVTVGSNSGATAGTTTIQSKGDTIIATNGTTRATFDNANNLTIGTNTTINNTTSVVTNSASAFQVQNTVGASALAVDTSTTPNVITNGSFETNTTGWTVKGAASGIARDTTQKYIGNAGMAITTTAAIGDGAKFNYTLSPSTAYTLSFFVKQASGGASFLSYGRQDNGSDIDCGTNVSIGTQWTRVSCTFTTGGTIGSSNIYLKQSDATARTIYIDAVQLQAGSTATPYQEGLIQLNGTINSPTVFRNQTNSNYAFNIQNAAGTDIFRVDSVNSIANVTGVLALSSSQSSSGISKIYTVGSTNAAANDVLIIANESGNARAITTTTPRDPRILGIAWAATTSGIAGNVMIAGSYVVNADATTTPIAVGDQLVTSSTAGRVMADNNATSGILGYAQSALASGTGTVNVYIRPVGGQSSPIFRNTSDSTTAFRIQNAGGTNTLFNANTQDSSVSITSVGTTNALTVSANANPAGATNALLVVNNSNASASGNLLALQNQGTNKFTVDASGNTLAVGTLGYANGTANSNTLVCRNGSGLLAACSAAALTGTAFIQGGNDFGVGVDGVLGTTQSGTSLTLKTGGTNRLTLDSTGSNLTFLQAATLNTNGALALGIDTGGAATLSLGATNATTINMGTSDVTRTVHIADGGSTNVQTVVIGSANSGSTTKLQGGTGTLFARDVGIGINTGASTVTADLSFGQNSGAGRTINVLANTTSGGAGDKLTLTAGAANGSGAAAAGGDVVMQGGAAAGTGNANGGNAIAKFGAGVGSGTQGNFQVQDSNGAAYLKLDNTSTFGSSGTLTCGQTLSQSCRVQGGYSLNLGGNTFGGNTIVRNGNDSANYFQIQNAAGTANLANFNSLSASQGRNLLADTSTANAFFDNYMNLTAATWSAKGTASGLARTTTGSQVFSGAGAATVTNAATNDGAKFAITLQDSATYTATFYAKGSSGGSYLAAGYSADGSTDTNCSLNSTTVSSTIWSRYTCTITTASSHSGTPYFYIKQTDGTARSIYFDNLYLEAGTSTHELNFITNSSFESNTTGWAARGGATISTDINQAFYGSRAGLITTAATDKDGIKFPLNLTSSTAYTLSFYARTSSSSFTLNFGRTDDGTTGSETNCTTGSVTSTWTRFSCSFTTGTISNTPYIYITQSGASARTFNIDGVTLDFGTTSAVYRDGTIQFGGIITSPQTTISPSVDNTNAFQVQNANGTGILNVDTVNNRVGINIGTATATADLTFGENGGAGRTLNVLTRSTDAAGDAFTISAGAGGAGSNANAGGTLNLNGGAGGGTNGNGGNVDIKAGAKNGSGNDGSINIGTTNTRDVTVGSGSGSTAGTTTLQSKNNTVVATNGTTRATFDTSNNLYLGNGTTAGSATTFVVQGTGGNAAGVNGSAITIQGGAGGASATGGALTLNAGSGGSANGALTIGTANTASIGLGAVGITTTNNGNLTIGSAAGTGTLFTNNGATLNGTKAVANDSDGGSLGGTPGTPLTAAQSVDIYTSFTVNQTTANQSITLTSPTNTAAGRIIYIANIGSVSFGLLGSTLNNGSTATLLWNGSAWTFAGADGTSINNQKAAGQNGDFWIQAGGSSTGIGRADGGFQAPSLDTVSGALSIGTSVATGITIGNTSTTTATSIQAAAGGTISVGTANAANAINIGSTSLSSGIQTITVGGANTAGGQQDVIVGSNASAGAGTTTIQSKGDTVLKTNGTTRATFSGSGNTLYVGNGNSAGQAATGNAFTIQGTSSTGSGTQGGSLTLQAGSGTSGNANGGDLTLRAGAGNASGYTGLVSIGTAAFFSAQADGGCYISGAVVTSNCTIAQASVDNFSAVVIGFNSPNSLTATLPYPTNNSTSSTGRVFYVTADRLSTNFVLSYNGGGAGNLISMRANSTATMIWNGYKWAPAGASSSTTLQAAYDNTIQNSGGAELIVSSTGSTNGLTIRDSLTNSVNGSLLNVQTSNAANLFSISSNVTEYAQNPGAESYDTTTPNLNGFPNSVWTSTGMSNSTITRSTTAANIATGQGSVQVAVGSNQANTGVKNTLSSQLNTGLTYNVSFTALLGSGSFSDMTVDYSKDGTVANATTNCASAQQIFTKSWTKVTCAFTVPSGANGSNAIFIRQVAGLTRTFYIDNLSVTAASSQSYVADGGVNSALGSNWVLNSGATVARSTTNGYEAGDSVQVSTNGTTASGVRNVLAVTPLASNGSTTYRYRVTAYVQVQSPSTALSAFTIQYLDGTNTINCVDYNQQSVAVSSSAWQKITCIIETLSTTPSSPYLLFSQGDATSRANIFIDNVSMTLANSTTPDVQIGSGKNGGPTTLFTLDSGTAPPIAGDNQSLLGSMYYDTSIGKIQCYQAAGWGSCGSAPDTVVTISPEYTNAVMHGTGIGTMTSDLCSDFLDINDQTNAPQICGTNESYNFYKWTSPQATGPQSYSIYVTYQLPTNFKSFTSGSTSLQARVDNTTNASVKMQIYKNHGGLSPCGTNVTLTTNANQWQFPAASGLADPSTCGFVGGDSIVFKITMASIQNANAYIGNLGFTFSNR